MLARALAPDAGARYASVADLAADVERFLAHRPVAARTPSPVRRTWLWTRRNRAASAAVLLGIVALATALAGAWREVLHARAEAGIGWRAHAQAALAARMLEDLAGAAHARAPQELERALDDAAARLGDAPEVQPETEGRLRIALGALYLDAGRVDAARTQLERALALTATTPGFGAQDVARVHALLARCAR